MNTTVNASYTPGPWAWDWYSDGDKGIKLCLVSEGLKIGTVRQSVDIEDPANKSLIAAAPELLRALKGAETSLVTTLAARGYETGVCTDGWSLEVRLEVATLVTIRQAIAKATGGAA
jgi:hypothetical protein